MLDPVYRYKDLKENGYGSRATIWRKVKAGQFPQPDNILGRPGWFGSTLQKYRNSKATTSNLGHEDVCQ